MAYGCEQALVETKPMKRLATKWLGTTHLGDRSSNHYLTRALRRITLPENANVLDAGCSNGAHSFHLAERHPDWKITGIDFDAEKIARARTISALKGAKNLSFQTGDLHDIQFTDLFHLIFSMHVFTFLRDDVAVLKRFFKALKRGGYLILSTPTPAAPSSISGPIRKLFQPSKLSQTLITKREDFTANTPVACNVERDGYSKEEIAQKLNEAGFHPLSITHPAGPFWQSAWEIETALAKRRLLKMLLHPFLLFLVDLDHWLSMEYPYPLGRDCLIVAQRPA